MEKLYWYLVLIIAGVSVFKVFVFWVVQKLLHPEEAKNKKPRLDGENAKVRSLFNQLLKARQLTRDDINIIHKILKKYSCKKYNSNVHMIYSVLKHGNIRRNDLGTIEVFLESKIRC